MEPVPGDSRDKAYEQQPNDEQPADGCESEDKVADVGECACRGHAGPEPPVPKDIQDLQKRVNAEQVTHSGLPSSWHGITPI